MKVANSELDVEKTISVVSEIPLCTDQLNDVVKVQEEEIIKEMEQDQNVNSELVKEDIETQAVEEGKEDLQVDTEDKVVSSHTQPDSDWKQDWKNTATKKANNFIEYLIGFVLGISFSLFGYRFLKYMQENKKKRKGVYIGCLISFLIILFLCCTYLGYTRNKLLTERTWLKHHGSLRHMHATNFGTYLNHSVSGISLSLFQIFPSHKTRKRNTLRNKRKHKIEQKAGKKIKTLKHLKKKIDRQLRVLL